MYLDLGVEGVCFGANGFAAEMAVRERERRAMELNFNMINL
jgi:hypothetical protein